MNFIDRILLFSFPFMDVGFILFGIPFRLGEITFFLFFIRLLNVDSILKITKINKIGLLIIILLAFNLILTVGTKLFTLVDNSFYAKYVLRNSIYFFAMISFILKPIEYEKINYDSFIKYILWIVVLFYFIEFVDYYVWYFDWENTVFVSRQGKAVFHDFIIRFAGQSSEPAYIIPLLSIPLMYGYVKREFKYVITSLILILLTFSSFGYLIILFSIVFFLKNSVSKELKRKARKIILRLMIVALFLVAIFAKRISVLIDYNIEKFEAYFGIGNTYEWSASQRSGHVNLAFDLFSEGSWYNKLLGNGTGYYSKMSKAFDEFYLDDAEEAHNLYISTLTDRGIIGLLILIFLFFFISKIKIPKWVDESSRFFFLSIKFGVYVRMLHWFFTGMLWQYYFWVEVSILIAASAYFIKLSNEEKYIRV